MLKEEPLTHDILGAAIEVHRILGPGLLESAYEQALCHELELRNVPYQSDRQIQCRVGLRLSSHGSCSAPRLLIPREQGYLRRDPGTSSKATREGAADSRGMRDAASRPRRSVDRAAARERLEIHYLATAAGPRPSPSPPRAW